YRLLERGPQLGHSWANTYDSLTLHTGKHMSALPGKPFPRRTPLFPTRHDFLAYLHDYARRFGIEVEPGVHVDRVSREDHTWIARAGQREYTARALVMATGIMAKPLIPQIAGRESFRGEVLHSVDYRRPAPFAGRRVLVVGVGNSGGEIASELGRAGVDITILVRSGANVVPRAILGVPIQYIAYGLRRLPPRAREAIAARVQTITERRRGPPVLPRPPWGPLDSIPLIGFHLVDAIRDGLVGVRLGSLESFMPDGVRFTDGQQEHFDIVIFATGFAPAIDALGDLVRRDARGFAVRRDRVASADQPDLYFVGHNYDATGGLANIRTDAVFVGARLARSG
ncbi:MAG TPA: NAD(P)/FAD-dependent oxidoreductase, partial [Gemmatimonadaceae bacterium]